MNSNLIVLRQLKPQGRYTKTLTRYQASLAANTRSKNWFRGLFDNIPLLSKVRELARDNNELIKEINDLKWMNHALRNECELLQAVIQSSPSTNG